MLNKLIIHSKKFSICLSCTAETVLESIPYSGQLFGLGKKQPLESTWMFIGCNNGQKAELATLLCLCNRSLQLQG